MYKPAMESDWNLNRFRDVECMKCKKVGLLSNGLCRQIGCGQAHKVKVNK